MTTAGMSNRKHQGSLEKLQGDIGGGGESAVPPKKMKKGLLSHWWKCFTPYLH